MGGNTGWEQGGSKSGPVVARSDSPCHLGSVRLQRIRGGNRDRRSAGRRTSNPQVVGSNPTGGVPRNTCKCAAFVLGRLGHSSASDGRGQHFGSTPPSMSMLQSSASLPRLSRVERKTDDQAKMEVRFPLPALSAPSAAVAERRGQSGRTTSGS